MLEREFDFKKLVFLVPIITAFVLRKPSVIRVLLCLLGIVLFMFTFFRFNSKKYIPYVLFISLFILVICDGVYSYVFKRIPIFTYNIVSKSSTRVYNSIGLRVWQCDKDDYKNVIVNTFDTKGYACDVNNITTVYANSFLSSVVENYSDYKNQYVKINGKISKKNSLKYIEMQAYNGNSELLNGYVEFYDNITLRIIFDKDQEELTNYDVYDSITVVGVIKNMEKDGNKNIIYMYESSVVPIKDLKDYRIDVTLDDNCSDKTLMYMDNSNNIYQYCLLNVVITYDDESKYDLSTVLSSGKMSIFDLMDNYNDFTKSNVDNSVLYYFNNYNILVCDENESNDVIIGNSKMNFNSVTCNKKTGVS